MRIKYVMPFFLRFNMIFMVFVNKGFIKFDSLIIL